MLTINDLDRLVTTAEAAEEAGVSQGAIRKWAYRGKIKKDGLDERGRPMYRLADVLRCERETWRQQNRGRSTLAAV